MTWLCPPTHLTLDIETIAGDLTEAEAALRRDFAPNPNWKAVTIGERYLEALEKKRERLALLDTAPIISVALRTPVDCRLLHWMPLEQSQLAGVPLERLADERSMLLRLREYLDACGPETILVGHNIKHFDLPRLRLAMIRYGLRLPVCLANPDHPIYDTMSMWHYFSVSEKAMISLEECLELAGLLNHKEVLSGADVPQLYKAGDFQTLAAYAITDVLAQDDLYLWMTGQAMDRPPGVSAAHIDTTALKEPVTTETPQQGEPHPAAPQLLESRMQAPAAQNGDDIAAILAELGIR